MSNPDPRQQDKLRLTMNETIPYLPGLPPVGGKELCARFDGGRLSSYGGVLLLREIERRLGIAELLGSRVTDERDPVGITTSQRSFHPMFRDPARPGSEIIAMSKVSFPEDQGTNNVCLAIFDWFQRCAVRWSTNVTAAERCHHGEVYGAITRNYPKMRRTSTRILQTSTD